MGTLRLGLLSTANINREILAGAAASDRVEVAAVGSRDRDRAESYAATNGIPRAHGSYAALLADDGVDAVYVSLPNGMHHEWTMRALAAGKHVLCEKPYTRRPAEVDEAFATAESAGLVLMEAFMYRHHPQTREIERLVREGAIGAPIAVLATFTFPLGDLTDVRAQPQLDGGALMDVGCYCVSGARLVAGEPVSVLAEQVTGPTGIDMALYGTMRLAGDVVAQFEASFVAPRRQYLEVVGEEAVLIARAPFRVDWGGALELVRGGETRVVDVPEASSYRLQLENLADAVEG
ncbi:MAG: Gfo/Idh/MocA family oxidoreductase, partial [Thermoleophilia bacterium]|nr:Gfo/Idh/MocA family oxidoreductase [Thermoleophilia bacterium]